MVAGVVTGAAFYVIAAAAQLPWDDAWNPNECVYADYTKKRRNHCEMMKNLAIVSLGYLLLTGIGLNFLFSTLEGKTFFFGCEALGLVIFVACAIVLDMLNFFWVSFFVAIAAMLGMSLGYLLRTITLAVKARRQQRGRS